MRNIFNSNDGFAPSEIGRNKKALFFLVSRNELRRQCRDAAPYGI